METTSFTLNAAQQAAVDDTEGAILVIAGAGSGKTRVLTARICHLLDMGVDPYNILAITFTNKAANEMKERIAQAIGSADVWTSTFHSMCAKILRIDADKIGYTSDFSIYTELESERVIKRIITDFTTVDVRKKSEFLWHISRAKTYSLSPAEYYSEIKNDHSDADTILQIYTRYESELKKCNAMDFDDLLLKTLELFQSAPEVLEKYRRRFKYVNVDEFQDTNALQYKIVKLLSGGTGNIFVVGDEDQSIYSWRGAEIKNILDFGKDFPGAKIYKLEQNYRSTTSILTAANNVIKNNSARNEKTLWSDIKQDDSVLCYEAYSDRDEASYVTREMSVLHKQGAKFKDMAVLVRANSLTRLFEEDFNLHAIPYKVFGGFRFFERKEIKDALAYVRMAINPSDNDSILRIINYPKRGIGTIAVSELNKAVAETGSTFFSVLINPEGLSAPVEKRVTEFAKIAKDLIVEAKRMQPAEFMQYAITRSGLVDALSNSADAEDKNRLENIEELVNAVVQFQTDNPELNISDFMQSVALVSDTDNMDEDDYVTIATVHAVKGLEFDNVFVVGLEEGIFPTSRAVNSGDIEEERRLMYVAITRARKRFFALNARSRYRFGETVCFPKSRFINEMTGSKQFVRLDNGAAFAPHIETDEYGTERVRTYYGGDYSETYKNVVGTSKTHSDAAALRGGKGASKGAADFSQYKQNTIVEHTKFGRGIIIQTSGEGEDKLASIAFKGLGVKRFSLAIAASSLKIVKE